jgi:serine/threonine protein kinase
MRQLDNKNVIKLYEIYETNNSFYMVLDMLSGGNLLDLISNKSLTNFNVMNIISGLIESVKYIHSKQIMHRDIKPENIMFKKGTLEADDVTLVDFGLSNFYSN